MARVIRGIGWTLIGFGVLILLFVVYLLFWTNATTSRAQSQLLDEWSVEVGALPGEEASPSESATAPTPIDPGDAYAAMWFERPGSSQPPVHADPLFVVEGVSVEHLKLGPGHYPETAAPGEDGNFSVSGHRTTYGAPFYNLDDLAVGDEIHVVDRSGRHWVYEVVDAPALLGVAPGPGGASIIVQPTDVWVISADPLGNGRPTLTLTTCHPRFSAAQRLIAFAQLRA